MARFINIENVIEMVGLGKSQIYELMKIDQFPLSIKIGRSTRWDEDEIYQWMETKKSTSRSIKRKAA